MTSFISKTFIRAPRPVFSVTKQQFNKNRYFTTKPIKQEDEVKPSYHQDNYYNDMAKAQIFGVVNEDGVSIVPSVKVKNVPVKVKEVPTHTFETLTLISNIVKKTPVRPIVFC